MKRSSHVLLERGMSLCTEVSFLYNFLKGRRVPQPRPSLVKNHYTSGKWHVLYREYSTALEHPCHSIPPAPLCEKHKTQPEFLKLQSIYVRSVFKIAIWEQCSAEKWRDSEPGLQVYERGVFITEPSLLLAPHHSSCAESNTSIPVGWRPEGSTRSYCD